MKLTQTQIKLALLTGLLVTFSAWGQGTLDDYKRSLALDTLYRGKVFLQPEQFHWIDSSAYCWYMSPTSTGKRYQLLDAASQSEQELFDHVRLSEALSAYFSRPFSPIDLVMNDLEVSTNAKQIKFRMDSAIVAVSLENYEVQTLRLEEVKKRDWGYWGSSRDELGNALVVSPNGKWVARIRDFNLVIQDQATKKDFQMSYDGTAGNFYSSYMEWSPDSRYLITCRIVPGEKNVIQFVESSPAHQLQPVLQSREYLKPGDALTQRYPQLFDVLEKSHIAISTTNIQDQYSVSNIQWHSNSKSFTFEYNQRGHQVYDILKVNVSGQVKTVIHEASPTFIDYSGKHYRYDLEATNEIIWASERDGWNHLHLYDTESGKVKNQITRGTWVVRSVVSVDEKAREITFTASGLDEDQDPYFIHYCKIDFAGKQLVRLTHENGTHNAWFSKDGRYFIDQHSRIDQAPVSLLKDAKSGKILKTVAEADISRLEATGWKAPEVFVSKGRDGKTDIWGIIVRPSNFDASRTYPLIEYIYAGPHSAFVPKSFRPYLWSMHSLAELGFVVVQIDGMGTSNRSKAFHNVCYQNLKDAGFPDRKLWIRAAAERYPYMDTTRVGIFGTSAGGQNAGAALVFHSDFYDVAVSSCGCHDNRMDKIWWNEQWMGKIGPHYEACSNVVNAAQLEGKLMLILGELDDNVDPASTMQFVNALVKANKEFELVMIPGMGHSSGGEFGERKRKDYFVKHLLGVTPPSWEAIYPSQSPPK